MRAVVLTKTGGPEVLQAQERPDPVAGPGQVRIAVKAAGINFADTMARVGLYPDAPKPPCVLGYEVAGEVESVGEGVGDWKAGDRVMAGTRFGGQAEMVAVDADQVLPLPEAPQLRAGRGLPGQLRDGLRGADHHGQPARGRPRPDPRGGRRGRHLGDADREERRRRDLRHRLAVEARRDPRAGRRARDRLPQPGLRGRGDAHHRRRGRGRRHRRDRADQLPQGLPRAAPGRARGHVRALRGLERRGPQHPQGGRRRSSRRPSRPCRGGRASR